MAWAEKLPSGKYRGLYRDASGRRHPVGETFSHEAEAKRVATLAEVACRQPLAADPRAAKRPWAAWADEWWKTRPAQVEPSTLKGDRHRLRNHLRPRWDAEQIGYITRDHVQAWVNELQSGELSSATIARIYYLFSGVMKSAVLSGWLNASPCMSIRLPRAGEGRLIFLSREELDAVIDYIPSPSAVMMVRLLVGTGARWGEAAALHRGDIDLSARTVRIASGYDGESKKIKSYTKGKRHRIVPITDQLADQLAVWMADTPQGCKADHGRGSKCSGGLVIPSSSGKVLDYWRFRSSQWVLATELAGVTATIHDLRHTYASWIRQTGVELDVISELLGHTTLQMARRYAHLGDTHHDRIRGALTAPARPEAPERGVAPHLPHEEDSPGGAKIISLSSRRRSAG